ncbi:MAG TPA: multicopper oxidase domain-containing protein [Actinomycetota bacterium]|nr:multicopper oxidase domain-containing protein [Actinomycetota bacterium]
MGHLKMRRAIRIGGVVIVLALLATACGKASEQSASMAYRINGSGSGHIVSITLDALETTQEIAPGVRYAVWTFGGTVPGPIIRVTQGDTVRFTLNNKGTHGLAHSIDFHAAQTPWNVNYVPVSPGKSITFDWVARFPGVFMYHCGVPPMLQHIANGMYGAIIVEPSTPLPKAREYVLIEGEFYPADNPVNGVYVGDPAKMAAVKPTFVVFDGVANQFKDKPLEAKPGELIRLWVVNAGPSLWMSFHVVGALFDHVYASGNPTDALNGLQSWTIGPGDGAMFELTIPDEGLYPMVNHSMAFMPLGAMGLLKITNDAPAVPAVYPMLTSPFSAGVTQVLGGIGALSGQASPTPTSSQIPSGPTIMAMDIKFSPTTLTVKARETITFDNMDPLEHNITIDALHLKVTAPANKTVSFSIAKPGIYTFYCSIPGHRQAGMTGTITVT